MGNKKESYSLPKAIKVRGVRVNNLKNLDIDIPLHTFVAVCGVSGSGKSSLAMGTLYAEGSRRYLETLSTYTRRRIEQASVPDMDEIRYLLSALALRQRPNVPNIRSTVGTLSETLNILRLMFSRLGSHLCPDGTYATPSIEAIQKVEITYSGGTMELPSAESFAFNGQGACPTCQGSGQVAEVDRATLIGDENKTIRQGAVAAWRTPGGMIYSMAAEALGIRTDVPFKDLSEKEKEMVLHGKPQKVPLKIDGGQLL